MDSKPPNFNFSLPPPGFSRPIQSYDVRQPPPPQGNGDIKYISIKKELNSPQPGGADSYNASRYGYYQGSNIQPNYSRLAGQNNMGMAYMHGSTAMGMGPRNFSIPPPPPPVGDSKSPAQMGYQNNPYSYGMPPTPSPPIIGAGQYATVKHGNYHQHHTQGDYNRGYDKRNGHYANVNRKRNSTHENDSDGPRKSAKKKKKPLSQNLPARKEWTIEEAQRAFAVESEYNKHKNPSLIIKFPDEELTREKVASFHPLIEPLSVHFQQSRSPRFCFLTLSDSSRIDEVIASLNKTKFGQGFLSAEPKNTEDETSVEGPEDIDPLTLYVGNLAQEVTVDDVVKAYPKHKRIDIGFARKMRNTRYAFVGFRTVDDAIEAFQNTHSMELFYRSLIVRFRRLRGTVGLPGETKTTQANPKQGKATDEKQQTESPPPVQAIGPAPQMTTLVYSSGPSKVAEMSDTSDTTKDVVIKSEFPEESTPNDGHVSLGQPKTEPDDEDLPLEIKQEMPDDDEPGPNYDFMQTFFGEDKEDP